MAIKMSRTQLAYNMKIDGGFLPILPGLNTLFTGTILLCVCVCVWGGGGSLSGLASTGVQNLFVMICFLRREVVCVRLKLMEKGCTWDLQAVKDFKLWVIVFS